MSRVYRVSVTCETQFSGGVPTKGSAVRLLQDLLNRTPEVVRIEVYEECVPCGAFNTPFELEISNHKCRLCGAPIGEC